MNTRHSLTALSALACALAYSTAFAQMPPPSPEPEHTPPASPSQSQPTAPSSQPNSPSTPETQQPVPEAGGGETHWPQFGSLDANGDGALSRDEVRAHAHLSGRFVELDADGSGTLSDSEYSRGQTLRPDEELQR